MGAMCLFVGFGKSSPSVSACLSLWVLILNSSSFDNYKAVREKQVLEIMFFCLRRSRELRKKIKKAVKRLVRNSWLGLAPARLPCRPVPGTPTPALALRAVQLLSASS